MQSLSRDTEKQILGAIQDVVEHVKQGSTPTAAVIKVASERQLLPDCVRLICTGYNTGITNFQRESSDTALEKFSAVPLASGDAAVAAIWPDVVKKPKKTRQKRAEVSDYAGPPKSVVRLPDTSMHKAAAELLGPTQPQVKQASQASVGALVRHKEKLLREVEQLRKTAADSQNQLLFKLAQFAQESGNLSDGQQADLRQNISRAFGDQGNCLLQFASVESGGLRKSAAAASGRAVDWNKAPYSTAKSCLSLAQDVVRHKQAFLAREAQVQRELEVLFRPFQKQAINVGTSLLVKGLFDAVSSRHQSPGDISAGMAERLADPDQENALRRIQAQAMLSDLLQNDEILSGHDPQAVLSAYNEIAQLSPTSSVQPALVRPWLRKRLSQGGAMEPFEAREIADTEGIMSRIRSTSQKVANVL